jgi:RNA methyltransferase, TrmH family
MQAPITSRRNPGFAALVQLARSPRELRANRLCVLEGKHLIEQYLTTSRAPLETLVMADGTQFNFPAARQLIVAEGLLSQLSDLSSPQPVIAFASIPEPAITDATQIRSLLVLEDIQDPGNVGAMLRTAAAVGIEEVWLSAACAYPWSQKVLRASQGAQFSLRVRDGVSLLERLPAFRGRRVVTVLSDAASLYETRFAKNESVAFLMGNEGAGISASLAALATDRINIPMREDVESLNVAVASGVVLYEWARQCQT